MVNQNHSNTKINLIEKSVSRGTQFDWLIFFCSKFLQLCLVLNMHDPMKFLIGNYLTRVAFSRLFNLLFQFI